MYSAASTRYDRPSFYRRCGSSGLKLPLVSLGLWQNFGSASDPTLCAAIVCRAFDLGVTHFDLANNYGPPAGAAEATFGRLLRSELASYRDEMIIATKAGYDMWPGPYGNFGSRKYLLASLDQSLRRMGLEYVDIFYHHRPDPETPLEETADALSHAVRSGKALHVGLSNYTPDLTTRMTKLLRANGTPCLVHQPKYNMFERTPEHGLFDVLQSEGIGCVAFSPLAQGKLTDRYLRGIPADSRFGKLAAHSETPPLNETELLQIRSLNEIAAQRGHTLAQLALVWALRRSVVTSVLIGASSPEQVQTNINGIECLCLEQADLGKMDGIFQGGSLSDLPQASGKGV